MLDTVKFRIKSQEDRDEAFSFFVCSYLLFDAINSVLQDVLQFSDNMLLVAKIFIALIMLILIIIPLQNCKKKEWCLFIVWEGFVFLAYLWSVILGSTSSKTFEWAFTTTVICVPLAIAVALVKDKGILYTYLYRFSWAIWIVLIVKMLGNNEDLYDMHFSYGLLLVILLHINELIKTRRKRYIVCLIIQLYMLVSFGSRGALVCIAVFLVVKVLTNVESKTKRRYYSLILIIVGVGSYLLLVNYSSIFYDWLTSQGYYSRTIKLLLTGQFTSHDSGRIELWNCTIELIKQKPILGWGIRGAVTEMDHPYPHNFFLDNWLSFGIPLGTIISVALIIPLRKIIIIQKGKFKDLIQVFFSIGFVSLLFSSTYFLNYYFFILMGLLLSYKFLPKGKGGI